MKQRKTSKRLGPVLAACSLVWLPAVADTETHTFTIDTGFVFAPPDGPPTIGVTFDLPQLAEALGPIASVSYTITTRLQSAHEVTSPSASQSFELQVGSSFSITPYGSTAVTDLNPLIHAINQSTSATANDPTVAGTFTDEKSRANISVPVSGYSGSGTVPIFVTAALNSASPGASWHNLTGGGTSPYTFVNNSKVFTIDELSQYRLYAQVGVTYTFAVPEASTWAAVVALASAASFHVWRRSRRTREQGAPNRR